MEGVNVCKDIDIFAALAAPFANDEVRTRSQAGREFQYVTARTVMNRLDEVLGPMGWADEYIPMENAIICKLTLTMPDGEKITKSDAGGFSTTSDTSDYEKTGFSDAFKRAAVKFGVARYLYGDGVPACIRKRLIEMKKPDAVTTADRLPTPDRRPQQPQRQGRRPAEPTEGSGVDPKTGKALFAWIKERDEKQGLEMLKLVSDWGKDKRFPARMVSWNEDQVAEGVAFYRATVDRGGGEPAEIGHLRR